MEITPVSNMAVKMCFLPLLPIITPQMAVNMEAVHPGGGFMCGNTKPEGLVRADETEPIFE